MHYCQLRESESGLLADEEKINVDFANVEKKVNTLLKVKVDVGQERESESGLLLLYKK